MKFLNDKYDNELRRISYSYKQPQLVYLFLEEDEPREIELTRLGKEEENSPNKKEVYLYRYTDTITPNDYNYIINIPLSLSEKVNEIYKVVEIYNQINLKFDVNIKNI
jgi:hypothetical protein